MAKGDAFAITAGANMNPMHGGYGSKFTSEVSERGTADRMSKRN